MALLMDGKAGLVTGAAGGIGRGVALELAREGAAVLVSDLERSRAGGEETVTLIKGAGGAAEFAPCDVTLAVDVEALVDRAVDVFGRLDYAVNNAGVANAIRTPLMEVSPPDFVEELIRPQAIKRFGEPEEVGFAVAYLCSDRAAFITGVALPIDGGYLTGA